MNPEEQAADFLRSPEKQLRDIIKIYGAKAVLLAWRKSQRKVSASSRKERRALNIIAREFEFLPWDDRRIANECWGTETYPSITPDGVRKALQRAYGRHRGLVLFHIGKRFGVSMHVARKLRYNCGDADSFETLQRMSVADLANFWCEANGDKTAEVQRYLEQHNA